MFHGLHWFLNDYFCLVEIAFGDLVFVDTPGFNDTPFYTGTGKISVDILIMLADWLRSTYVLVDNFKHYCLDVISADIRKKFSAAASTSVEYPTIRFHSELLAHLHAIYACSRNSAAKKLSITSF